MPIWLELLVLLLLTYTLGMGVGWAIWAKAGMSRAAPRRENEG